MIVKKILIILFIVFTASFISSPANAQTDSYVKKYRPMAEQLAMEYGIPVNVMLAIAIVESSCGIGKVAKVLNNHFGMIGKNTAYKNTGHKSRYKQYATATDSYEDFCRMISNKKFYPTLKNNTDYKLWVKSLSKAGYSEVPAVWEQRILSTIETNRL